MKIKNIRLRNYKKFVEPVEFSFTDSDGEVNEKTLLVGNNGTGKSSILQAIVYLIASATKGKEFTAQSLDWEGFEERFLQTGQMPLQIEAEILFGEDEIAATREYAERLKEFGKSLGVNPTQAQSLILSLDFEHRKIIARKNTESRSRPTAGNFFQFSGYQYAKTLAPLVPNKNQLFERVGDIFWYTEQRNSYSFSKYSPSDTQQLDFLRNLLVRAYYYHSDIVNGKRIIQVGQFDLYAKLEELYQKVFPDRKFIGATPNFVDLSAEPDFFLTDGKNQYELSGMSAGERAIFPILMDFARLNINNSIIIIDEIELHLHPPLQQQFIRAITRLGNNNQFIFTSHSNSVITMFDRSENQIIRLSDNSIINSDASQNQIPNNSNE